MKVLQINAVYGHGSTGTIVRDIEQLCEQNGIECYVASPDPKVREAKCGYVIGNALDHKLHALLCRINGMQGYFSHIPTWNLCKYIDQIKPDVVHLHNLHSNYIHLNILLRHLAKRDIKTIITLHDCWFYTGGCFHYTAVGCDRWLKGCGHCPKKKKDTPALLFDRSSQVLADRKKYLLAIPHLCVTGVSKWIANEAMKTFLKDTPNKVIPNGIDLTVFKPTQSDLRKRLGLEGKYIILGPARKWLLEVNKGVLRDFTQSMKPDEVLLLFGCVQKPKGLPDNVHIYGYTKNQKEMAQLYTMSDVFVNVTREDSLSLINIEAQACGTPVVTFDATGPKETVDDIVSKSIPVGNVELLLSCVHEIRIKSSNNELSNSFITNHYEVNTNYQKYINLYKQ